MSRDLLQFTGSEILTPQEQENLLSNHEFQFLHGSGGQLSSDLQEHTGSNIDLMRILEDKDGLLVTL